MQPLSIQSDRTWIILTVLWLIGFSLRVTILALPPVLQSAARALDMDAGEVGMVTAVPSFIFALGALPAAVLIARYGLPAILLGGLAVAMLGSMMRIISDATPTLLATTGIMSLGIALVQTTLPMLSRTWLPGREGLATATYTFGLLAGEIAPAAFVVEHRIPPAAIGWPSQLLGWSLPVLLAAIVVAAVKVEVGRRTSAETPPSIWPDWRDPVLWQAGAMLGAVNAIYFSLNGFIPGWLAHSGGPAMARPALLALNAAQVPAALLMLWLVDRLVVSPSAYIILAAGLLLSGVVLGAAPDKAPIVAAASAGFLLAALLSLALTVPALVADHRSIPGLTAGVFTAGYGVAVVTILATGWLQGRGPSWVGIVPIGAAAATIIFIGPMLARRVAALRSVRRDGC